MRTESADDGQAPMPSAQVVSKVLSENTSNNTFLKNIGVPVKSKKSETLAEKGPLKNNSPLQTKWPLISMSKLM